MLSRSEAAQRHHDHYVRLSRSGKLPLEDQPNLEAAMRGEKAGEVSRLPGGRFDSLRLMLATVSYRLARFFRGPESLLPKHLDVGQPEDLSTEDK